jgi:ribA/ribD-fused uncharacterized protein
MEKPKLLYTETGPLGTPYKKGDWKEFAIHTEECVKGFFGEYQFLSNFWPAKVMLDGVEYKSAEVAYQAAKWKPENRDFFLTCTKIDSIDYNRKNTPDAYTPEDWTVRKLEVMKDLVHQKFDPALNLENYELLQTTGNKQLEEMNWWGDTYWGTDRDGNGENMLGKILMEVRISGSR